MAQQVCVVLSAAEREQLVAIAADRDRPRIVLASADRYSAQRVAQRIGVSRPTVWRWQQRCAESGVEGLRHAIWLYLHCTRSYRDGEELLAERGLDVSYETVRRWVLKFGPLIARKLRKGRPRASARWHLDEMVVGIAGKRMYLWRAVDHEGEVLDMLVQRRRDTQAGTPADAQAAQETGLRTDVAGHRQAGLLRLGFPRATYSDRWQALRSSDSVNSAFAKKTAA
jgi:transposase